MADITRQNIGRSRTIPNLLPQRESPCWFLACLGTLTFGLFVPVFLATLYANGQPSTLGQHNDSPPHKAGKHPFPEAAPQAGKVIDEVLQLGFATMMLCGPGAFILAVILYAMLKRGAEQYCTADEIIAAGLRWGIVLAFANIPGYLSGFIIGWHNPWAELRVALLFASAGAVSGSWIGWQVWRATHLEAGYFPQFSLKTLMIGTIALAALFGIFAPAL